MERSRPLNSHSAELSCRCQSISYIDHTRMAGKRRLRSPLLDVRCNRNLMRTCQLRTGKQINGTQCCRQGRDTAGGEGRPQKNPVLQAPTFRNNNILVSSASQRDEQRHPFWSLCLKVNIHSTGLWRNLDFFPSLCLNKEHHRGTTPVCWNVRSKRRRGTKEEELQLRAVRKDDKSSAARLAVAACVARAAVPERGTRSTAVIILRSARCSSMADFISRH